MKSCSNCIECEEYSERCRVHNMPIPRDERDRQMFAKDCKKHKEPCPYRRKEAKSKKVDVVEEMDRIECRESLEEGKKEAKP